MKKLFAITALLLLAPGLASAQKSDHHSPFQGYFLFGFGTDSPPINQYSYLYPPGYATHSVSKQLAFGGEVVSKPGLGLGFEMGWIRTIQNALWVRTPSLYVSYHFPKLAHRKIEPFVDAGATLMYDQFDETRGAAAANFGGGVNFWFMKHVGLRCDVKDFRQGHPSPEYPNFLELRVGVAFR
jgi:hypothetical protein